MQIPCFRCGTLINEPHGPTDKVPGNADYIIAFDTMGSDIRQELTVVKYNATTRGKQVAIAQYQELETKEGVEPPAEISEEDYDRVIVPSVGEANRLYKEDLVRVEVKEVEQAVTKTGLICPDCYNPDTDTVIWGVHKK